MALAKRRDDLVRSLNGQHCRSLDGYTEPFLDTAIAVVLGALLVAYLDLHDRSRGHGRARHRPPGLHRDLRDRGALRYLQITLVEQRSGSPTALALTDRFLIATALSWAATLAALIHL